MFKTHTPSIVINLHQCHTFKEYETDGWQIRRFRRALLLGTAEGLQHQ